MADKNKDVVVIEAATEPEKKKGVLGQILGVGQNIVNWGRPPEIETPENLQQNNTATTVIVVVVLLALLAGVYFITKKK